MEETVKELSTTEVCLPRKPEEPSQEDCCGSGCTYCVFDVYEKELAKWEKECERLVKGGRPSEGSDLLSPLEFKDFSLIKIIPSAHELNIYRFSVPDGIKLDIKPGQHLMMKGCVINQTCDINIDEDRGSVVETVILTVDRTNIPLGNINEETIPERKYLSRAYTILNNEHGYFETLIKVYNDGKMSQYINTLKVGDSVLWRGPFGDYHHCPSYSLGSNNGSPIVVAVCAGTGVAPVYAISKSIVSDEEDETRIRLLWANRSWECLPLVEEFKELASYWNFSCRLFFSSGGRATPVSHTFFEITYSKINFQALSEEFSTINSNDIKVLLCGSLSFEEDMLVFLDQLGIQNCNCYRFE
ncbi:NADH-cytochrome b5 reductase-like isoform X1 [Ischnura elegans]|uniref:NADH-cytochrome b5 reductase-like isoform X1 n=1 Tax=Ischnura elegans TaxID=197161 RepID=UPI001ED8665C|nr:NADH-cytochrome b5 reductase-like isoform X1 [Ischnura elegans]